MGTTGHLLVSPDPIRDTRVSMSARCLYHVILTDAAATGYCTKTNAEFGAEMNRSGNHVSRLISELVKIGYIERKIVYSKNKPGEIIERQLFPRAADVIDTAKALTEWRCAHG